MNVPITLPERVTVNANDSVATIVPVLVGLDDALALLRLVRDVEPQLEDDAVTAGEGDVLTGAVRVRVRDCCADEATGDGDVMNVGQRLAVRDGVRVGVCVPVVTLRLRVRLLDLDGCMLGDGVRVRVLDLVA